MASSTQLIDNLLENIEEKIVEFCGDPNNPIGYVLITPTHIYPSDYAPLDKVAPGNILFSDKGWWTVGSKESAFYSDWQYKWIFQFDIDTPKIIKSLQLIYFS